MTIDKFSNNMYFLLTVTLLLLIALMMHVNILNTIDAMDITWHGSPYTDSLQVNPDLPPHDEQNTLKDLYFYLFILLLWCIIWYRASNWCYKIKSKVKTPNIFNKTEFVILYLSELMAFAGIVTTLLFLTLLLLFETF